MTIHQFNPDMAPDSSYTPGALRHLVVGNRGRWLDPRRTPFVIVALKPETGHFVLQIEDFEDKGARMDVPFERVASYQFERECAEAPPADVQRAEEIVRRFDRPLRVPCDPRATARTSERLAALRGEAGTWLRSRSTFLERGRPLDTRSRRGSEDLCADLQRFMEQRDVLDIELAFASVYVSNPRDSELVKGHRIVLAEMGLPEYEGKIVRDAALFDGRWTKERRAEHVLSRLAFLRALFSILGRPTVALYRGVVFDGQPDPPRCDTFVSASFDFEVAHSCFAPRETSRSGALIRQVVPVERLFMTYLETAEMNRQYLEAEAVLLHEPGNVLF